MPREPPKWHNYKSVSLGTPERLAEMRAIRARSPEKRPGRYIPQAHVKALLGAADKELSDMRTIRAEAVKASLAVAFRLSPRVQAEQLATLRKQYSEATGRFNEKIRQVYEDSQQTKTPLDRRAFEFAYTSHKGISGIVQEIAITRRMDGTLVDRLLVLPPSALEPAFKRLSTYLPQAEVKRLRAEFQATVKQRINATFKSLFQGRTLETAFRLLRRGGRTADRQKFAEWIDYRRKRLTNLATAQQLRGRQEAALRSREKMPIDDLRKQNDLLDRRLADLKKAQTMEEILGIEEDIRKRLDPARRQAILRRHSRTPVEVAQDRLRLTYWRREITSLLDALPDYYRKLSEVKDRHRLLNHLGTLEEHLAKLALAYVAFDARVEAFQDEFLVHPLKETKKSNASFVWAYKENRRLQQKVREFFDTLNTDKTFNETLTRFTRDSGWRLKYASHMRGTVDVALKDKDQAMHLPLETIRQRVNETGFLKFKV